MENPVTKRFGRYEVVAELGRGAMGVVYKARDPQIDRLVAVKTVSLWGQEPEEEKEYRLRFMNEAQAAGRLQHAGIVAIFDVGEEPENHDPYIVLEYVAGEALNRILAREKKLPLETALRLTEEIAQALDYAHAQGVTHRDIKPANILVSQDGHAKVADFGIAKLNLAHFTVPGRVLGTPAYMSPEQLNGEGADGRSDLFSLGVILYAMVTGHSPFQGNSATTVSFKVTNREPVAASTLDLSLPGELDAVIARAMAKDPGQRYQRGAEFAADVRQLQDQFYPDPSATWLRAATGSRTASSRTGTATSAAAEPAAALVQAEKAVRGAIRKAPTWALILGAATVVMLVIAGVQSKLLVTSSKVEVTASDVAPPNFPNHPAVTATTTEARGPMTGTPGSTPRKAHGQTSHPAKQVIVPCSDLELVVQHEFKDATLYVWVDDKLALTRPLHGGTQKRLVVFNGIRGLDSETLKIPAGKHVLRLRAVSADQTIDLSKTVSADFIGGDDRSLRVTFDKHNAAMRLSWR
jgi:eukaryotic-like serine/threonine-protein kinase